MKVTLWAAVFMAATAGVSFAEQAQPSEPKVLSDGVGAKVKRFENMNGVRFIEIFLAAKKANADNLTGLTYNTLFNSGGVPASKDTAPQALVEGLNMDKLAKDFGVAGALLNGPKIWSPDWLELPIGVEREFNGMKAPWVAELQMGKELSIGAEKPYEPMAIKRSSKWGWNKGTVALLLDDPAGNVWILKGFQLGLTPKYTYKEFVAAGQSQFKQLPPGWKFRVKTLEADLIEIPETGVATIMPDEFFNIYDKTGPGMTNYKP